MRIIIAINIRIRDLHEYIIKIEIIKGWENFLISLMQTYHIEKMEKKMIDVYIGIKEHKKDVLVSLHYDIPYELIEFYGEENFKSVMIFGSKMFVLNDAGKEVKI